MKRIGRLEPNEMLLVMHDGTIQIATIGTALHGPKIIALLFGKGMTDDYLDKEITPRLAENCNVFALRGDAILSEAERVSGVHVGSDLTIGDSPPMKVTDVKDITKSGDFPTFEVKAERDDA